ncbi:unnamed protein product, partial [Amoebophrya sp. A120]
CLRNSCPFQSLVQRITFAYILQGLQIEYIGGIKITCRATYFLIFAFKLGADDVQFHTWL